jgi:hypothetical protein
VATNHNFKIKNGLTVGDVEIVSSTGQWVGPSSGLVGPPGADGLNGSDGDDGADGDPGESAYQIAVNNGFVGTEAQWIAGLVTATSTHTLTNKTVAFGSNTVSGTLAQFNTALTDADFATLAGTETLTNKTLTSPVVTGGSINNTPIGATTANTGRFSDLTDTGLTATRVVYAGTGGNLVDSANLTFNGTTLTAGGLTTTGVLTVQPSATTGSVGSLPTGASIITNSNTNNYHVFRNSPDNSTYSGIVMQDNNIGGYVIYGNSGVGDKMYIAGYSAVDILVGITDNINPASRTTIASFSSSGMSVTSLTETSSIKYKENIKPISNALEQLSKLQGVIYDRIDTGVKQEAGLIAEDVFKVLPNLVQLDDEGNPMGVKYTKLTAYLIECIKELKLEIETLKQK